MVGQAVRASYDAVRQTWGDRSWLFQALQDSWLEIDSLTRQELQRVHDYLIENACIVQKIRSLYLQFSVGPSGLIVTPNASRWKGPDNTPDEKTRVEDWNRLRSESWERWWRRPELNSEITGAQLTRVWSGLLFDKGEIFVNLTEEKLPGVNMRVQKVQTIDAHRCCSPEGMFQNGNNIIRDGVEMTKEGRVVAYWFKKSNLENYLTGQPGYQTAGVDSFDRIEKYDKQGRVKLIHKFKVRRPGQIRGIPEGFSVYNIVRDNLDLHKLEMQCAKLASSIGTVETNASGELDPYANRRAKMGIGTQNNANQATTKEVWADYRVTIGGQNIALRSGDKLENFMVQRPTVATQNYWDLHYTLICIGYEIPKLLVMPTSLQGTVTRADLDIASYGFGRVHFEIIKELLCEVYEWQTDWAIKFDRSMDGDAPEDFMCIVIDPPRSPNVDVGYNASALETELRLGVKTIPEVFAQKQQDFRQKTREIAEYLKFVNDLAEEYQVDAGAISELAMGKASSAEDDPEKEEVEPSEKEVSTE